MDKKVKIALISIAVVGVVLLSVWLVNQYYYRQKINKITENYEKIINENNKIYGITPEVKAMMDVFPETIGNYRLKLLYGSTAENPRFISDDGEYCSDLETEELDENGQPIVREYCTRSVVGSYIEHPTKSDSEHVVGVRLTIFRSGKEFIDEYELQRLKRGRLKLETIYGYDVLRSSGNGIIWNVSEIADGIYVYEQTNALGSDGAPISTRSIEVSNSPVLKYFLDNFPPQKP